jgi:hypothetical protein
MRIAQLIVPWWPGRLAVPELRAPSGEGARQHRGKTACLGDLPKLKPAINLRPLI